MRLMREEIGYASANLGRERANVRAAYEELGKGHQERDAAPLGVADLARPLRNGLLCGDVVGAGAVSFREVSMSKATVAVAALSLAVGLVACGGAETLTAQAQVEQGDAAAQFNLGMMHYNGEGVPQDSVEAAAWFRRAAEQGHANAQVFLGLMYANGEGVPQDSVEAVAWYRKAAEQGHANAQSNLGWMYANGAGVPQDDAEAVAWYRKAAEQSNASAQVSLGLMYANGEGVPQDSVEAAAWFREAAEQGHADAQHNLGQCMLRVAAFRRIPSKRSIGSV